MDLSAPNGIPSESVTYTNFRGLDRSRSITALENREQQPLWNSYNAVCDWRASIRREFPLRQVSGSSNRDITTIKFWNRGGTAFAEREAGGVSLNSDQGHRVPLPYSPEANVTMTVFRGKIMAMCEEDTIYQYDGSSWSQNDSGEKAAFGVSIQERLFVHNPEKPTEVLVSRVKDAETFPVNEDPESQEATKAAFIDIQNLIGTADNITALGAFEANRLAIFTNDQTLVYKVDPDFSVWELDNRANIRVGCISGRAVTNVGSDLIFCSRHGVHSLMRSEANGVTISEITLSNQIEDYYKKLIAKVPDPRKVSVAYDQDEGELHIWFPFVDGSAERLTLSLRGGYENAKWSQGNTLNASCGDFLAGRLVVGTPGGLFEYIKEGGRSNEFTEGGLYRGKFDVWFPLLYHGDIKNQKEVSRLMIHASGNANLIVHAYDELGNELSGETFAISAPEEEAEQFPYNPLEYSFEIMFNYRYRGVQLRIETPDGDNGDVRIYAISVDVNKPPKD